MTDLNKFYVYEHSRADTGEIFYVGKGCGNRLNSTRATHRNQRWLRTVAKAGAFTARKIIDRVDEEFAFLIEMERIDQLRRLGTQLCNITNGGDGATGFRHSDEAKARMSVKWKAGRVMSQAQRDSVSARHTGTKQSAETVAARKLTNAGLKHSEVSKAKMSVAQRGKKMPPVSQVTRDKLSAAHAGVNHRMYGKHHSESTKRKMSESKLGKPGMTIGHKATEESKARMSAAQLGDKSHLFGTKQDLVECPHCGKVGGCRSMMRWHFDNCKRLEVTCG